MHCCCWGGSVSPEHLCEASGVYPRDAAYCNMLLMVLAVDSSFRCFVVYLHRKQFLLDLSQLTTLSLENKNSIHLDEMSINIPVQMFLLLLCITMFHVCFSNLNTYYSVCFIKMSKNKLHKIKLHTIISVFRKSFCKSGSSKALPYLALSNRNIFTLFVT